MWFMGGHLCPCREFSDVMGGAEHGPFTGNLFDASEEELAEASGLFDVSEDGFDDLFA